MASENAFEIIKNNPIGERLQVFRNWYKTICQLLRFDPSTNLLEELDENVGRDVALKLVEALCSLPVCLVLPSSNHNDSLLTDLINLDNYFNSENVHIGPIIPLLQAVINNAPDDAIIAKAYAVVFAYMPPSRTVPLVRQSPWLRNASDFPDSLGYLEYMDNVVRAKLKSLYVGVSGFYDTFFQDIPCLEETSLRVFRECQEGVNPLYSEQAGWRDWPSEAREENVLSWLIKIVNLFIGVSNTMIWSPNTVQRPLAQSIRQLNGCAAEHKLDIGFMGNTEADAHSTNHWSNILVPGQLKSEASQDTAFNTWLDLAAYAGEILLTQNRRFCLGFTICGSIMRLWEFDRVGGVASDAFDINKNAHKFIATIFGFLWMKKLELGFDPTIIVESPEKTYMEIIRNGSKERLILEEQIRTRLGIGGRATRCWKAYREGDISQRPVVIKDSWLSSDMGEGELLKEATKHGVKNVARYYHHETVHVGGNEDDVGQNIRKGLDVSEAATYNSTKHLTTKDILNRTHHRLIVCDYGKPIYRASSLAALLGAFSDCIDGYKSLLNLGKIIHRDISPGNLLIKEDRADSIWPAFLIDLELGIKEQSSNSSDNHVQTESRMGPKSFMAIGVLFGEQHTYMHDYESFFWVLFWICVHYESPSQMQTRASKLKKWNSMDSATVALTKAGIISGEEMFSKYADFTGYYKPLFPCVNRLRKVLFPDGKWRNELDQGVAERMKKIFRAAQEDLRVIEK